MSKSQERAALDAEMERFLQNHKVTHVPEGQRVDPALRHCRCGCEGSYGEHQMRSRENEEGRYHSFYGQS